MRQFFLASEAACLGLNMRINIFAGRRGERCGTIYPSPFLAFTEMRVVCIGDDFY